MAIVAREEVHPGWWIPRQLEAMRIAQRHRIPTVNGYTGWTPPGWDLRVVTAPGYRARVRAWARRHAVETLCEYDVDGRVWFVRRRGP
jgi:hypothetical protein